MLRLVPTLNANAPAIQAIAAGVSVLVTAVLAWITWRYVRWTRHLVVTIREELDLLRSDRQAAVAERRVGLLTLILSVRLIITALPRDRPHAAAIVTSPLWSPSDPDLIVYLAAAYGRAAAVQAAEASRHLAVLRDLATAARSDEHRDVITWQRFPWDRWHEAIAGAERCLRSVETLVEGSSAP